MLIAEEIRELVVPIDSIHPHPQNPWNGDEDRVGEALARFGQIKPITVHAETGNILRGHTVYAAMLSLGAKSIAVIRKSCDEGEALRILLNDNRTKDSGAYDIEKLLALTNKVGAMDRGLVGTGYSPDDLDALLGTMNAAPSPGGDLGPSTVGPSNPARRPLPLASDPSVVDPDEAIDLPPLPPGADLTQVILWYPRETYEPLVDALDALLPSLDDTYTDVVLRLVGAQCE